MPPANDDESISTLREKTGQRLRRFFGQPEPSIGIRENINVRFTPVQAAPYEPDRARTGTRLRDEMRQHDILQAEEALLRRESGIAQEQQRTQEMLLRGARTEAQAGERFAQYTQSPASSPRGILSGTAQTVGGAYRAAKGTAQTVKVVTQSLGEGVSKASVKNYGVFFLLTYFVNAMDGVMNYSVLSFRITAYFLLGFFGWLLVFREIGDTWKGHLRTLLTSLLVATGALLWPVILLTLPKYAPIDTQFFRILANIFPFYLIYLLFFERDPQCQNSFIIIWSKRIYFVTLILLAIAFVPAIIESQTLANIPFLQPAKNAEFAGTYASYFNLVTSGYTWLKSSTMSTYKSIGMFWEQQKKIALGDLYVGEVDENAQKRTGVELTDVKSAQKKYTTFDDVEIQGTVKVTTLDKDLSVHLMCTADKNIKGKTAINASRYTPDSTFTIIKPGGTEQREFFTCNFPAGALDKGAHAITIESRFDFRTSAYMQIYFVDAARARSIREQGQNIYQYFQIREQNSAGALYAGKISDGEVKTYYTSGPVNIGMHVPNLVTEVDQIQAEKILNLRISFTNMWGTTYGGRIRNLRDWYIQIPKEMRLLENSQGETACSGRKFILTQCPENDNRCDRVNFKTYMLDPRERINDVDFSDTVVCTLVLSGNSYADLFAEYPLAARQIRTWMTYDYSYERKVDVSITQEEAQNI